MLSIMQGSWTKVNYEEFCCIGYSRPLRFANGGIVPAEGFQPFLGDTFIALDQSVKKTGFMNCLVLDE